MIIAANRLPVCTSIIDGKIVCTKSPGGLAATLDSLLGQSTTFVGWPGSNIPPQYEQTLRTHLLKEHAGVPVFLTDEDRKQYYLGFSNSVLWPLFHNFPEKMRLETVSYERYKQVNRRFAEKISEVAGSKEIVFIQDYQLLLTPQFLREHTEDVRIGFFLHTPFPSYEVLYALPKVILQELLSGILGADVIGFHTASYMEAFKKTLWKTLQVNISAGSISWNGRSIVIEHIPLGIDYQKFVRAKHSVTVKKKVAAAKKWLKDKKILFSVDRLDYTKGITKRLLGYELLLHENPKLHRNIIFFVRVEPSRTEIEEYKHLKIGIETLIQRINDRFGDTSWQPIQYSFSSLSFEQMVIHYSIADICVTTPLRDGMNLIAKEFVATKEQNGVLILSHEAGAAEELTDALLVNPQDISDISGAMEKALRMDESEQRKRIRHMQQTLREFTAEWWAGYWVKLLKTRRIQRDLHPDEFGKLRTAHRPVWYRAM